MPREAHAPRMRRGCVLSSRARELVYRHQIPQWGSIALRDATAIHIARGEGPWLVTGEGQRLLDWSSQAICAAISGTRSPLGKGGSESRPPRPSIHVQRAGF